MAIENLTNVPTDIILEIGKIALWLQTVGIIIILWILFEIISLIINRKKRKAIYSMKSDLKRIENKLDKLLQKKKK
ncbi:MAG: hypothetical protein OQK82_08430 [Candidatus Pacearchaeota archaeon]|nr:hypothetical protein [Candidatus Pacearchaeota archaeon]